MNGLRNICAVVPVKDTRQAKQRLAGMLDGAQRQQLALAMFEDVVSALAAVRELAGILVVTVDRAAGVIAARHGGRVSADGACAGHTGAIAAAARRLAADGLDMLTLPGDVPLVEPQDIRELIRAHRSAIGASARALTIVPARDERGSNGVLCSPADAVPLRFGDDSFLPHLLAARERGIEPTVLRLPRIALDIDTPDDLALLLADASPTRSRALLDQWQLARVCGERNQSERQSRCAPSPTRPGPARVASQVAQVGPARVASQVAQVGQARLGAGEGWGGG